MVFMTCACVSSSPVSSPTMLRSRMTMSREQVRSISSISEEMNVMLMPSSASFSTSFWISSLVPTSMPRVGSSRIRYCGCVSSQRARMTFCWLPPESDLIGVSCEAVLMSSALIYSSAKASAFARGIGWFMPRMVCRARMMFSRTERSAMMPSRLRSSGR